MPQMKKINKDMDIDLDVFFPYVVSTVTRIFHSDMESNLKELGINLQEWRVLIYLSRNETGTLNNIVDFTKFPQPSLSRTIRKMSQKKLLTNLKKNTDSRFLELRITPLGREIVASANKKLLDSTEERLSIFTKKERSTLLDTLWKLISTSN